MEMVPAYIISGLFSQSTYFIIHLRFCQRTHYPRVIDNKCWVDALTYNEKFYQLLRKQNNIYDKHVNKL